MIKQKLQAENKILKVPLIFSNNARAVAWEKAKGSLIGKDKKVLEELKKNKNMWK